MYHLSRLVFKISTTYVPVHRDQLKAQRSVTSMGSIYLYLTCFRTPGHFACFRSSGSTFCTRFPSDLKCNGFVLEARDIQTDRQTDKSPPSNTWIIIIVKNKRHVLYGRRCICMYVLFCSLYCINLVLDVNHNQCYSDQTSSDKLRRIWYRVTGNLKKLGYEYRYPIFGQIYVHGGKPKS